jgi:hypothetical protein
MDFVMGRPIGWSDFLAEAPLGDDPARSVVPKPISGVT